MISYLEIYFVCFCCRLVQYGYQQLHWLVSFVICFFLSTVCTCLKVLKVDLKWSPDKSPWQISTLNVMKEPSFIPLNEIIRRTVLMRKELLLSWHTNIQGMRWVFLQFRTVKYWPTFLKENIAVPENKPLDPQDLDNERTFGR